MASGNTTREELGWIGQALRSGGGSDLPALVIAWSLTEPWRIGECALLSGDETRVVGRGEGPEHLVFRQQRPGSAARCPPLGGQGISRRHVELRATDEGVTFTRMGRSAVEHCGAVADEGSLVPGDTLAVQNQLLLTVVRRPLHMAAAPHFDVARHAPAFGAPDAFGLVGESLAAWSLREHIAFVAQASAHALVLGPSGCGKELVSRAIHELSARRARPLVSRSAATIPESILDAELFGNLKNYPNPGTPERMGLVGEADGSTLFLDEIAELPPSLQAHLLRLLDAAGEYHRLGEARARRADLRLVGATNRAAADLKHDLAARLTLRLEVPGLDERPDDVPLVVRELLRRAELASPTLVRRFFHETDGHREARLHPSLVDALVRHRYTLHVRELDALLWRAIHGSRDDYIDAPEDLLEGAARPGESTEVRAAASPPPLPPARPRALERADIEAALARHAGRVTAAAEELGLPSRFALYRLMRRLGIERPHGD